jgi:transcriptional regulator with XRE-family HTH domain
MSVSGLSKEELGKKLRETREKLNMTQEEVASKAGLNTNYYAVIERGEVDPGMEKITKIFEVLGIKLLFP